MTKYAVGFYGLTPIEGEGRLAAAIEAERVAAERLEAAREALRAATIEANRLAEEAVYGAKAVARRRAASERAKRREFMKRPGIQAAALEASRERAAIVQAAIKASKGEAK